MRRLNANQQQNRQGIATVVLGLCLAACGTTTDVKATSSVAEPHDATPLSDAVPIELPDPATCPVGVAPPVDPTETFPNFHGCATTWPDEVVASGGAASDDHQHAMLTQWGGTALALSDGEWLGLNKGIQGSGHAFTGFAIDLGEQGPTATIDLVTATWYSCETEIGKPLRQVQLVRASQPGWYAMTEPLFWMINKPIYLACGRWFQLQVFARFHGTQHWTKTDCSVRMYSIEPLE